MESPLPTILRYREGIRSHRDQIGDYRCWIDDHSLWELLPDTKERLTRLPLYSEGMSRCGEFYKNRSTTQVQPIPPDAITDKGRWDEDLATMDLEQMVQEVAKLEIGIRKHRDIPSHERTYKDDMELYALLPEKLPAEFRLPPEEEFLGVARPNAGCPNFWKSHGQCETDEHDLHQWGPCGLHPKPHDPRVLSEQTQKNHR